MAGSTFGAIGELIFGQPELKTLYANDPLQKRYTGSYIDALDALRTKSSKTTSDFAAALAAATPEAERLRAEDIATLGSQAAKRTNYDPLADYERLLSTKTGSLKSFVPDIMGVSNAALARKRLGLGITGSAPTTYDRVAGLSALGSSLAPILNTIYSTTGPETAMASSARSGNLADIVNLLAARRALPDQLAYRSLLPQQTEMDLLGQELGLAGGLGSATAANIQGYRTESDPWANLFDQFGQEVQGYANSFAGGLGGAMGGGMFGGAGGIGSLFGGAGKSAGGAAGMGQAPIGGYLGYDAGGFPVTQRYPSYYAPAITGNWWN